MYVENIKRVVNEVSQALGGRDVVSTLAGESIMTIGRTKEGGILITRTAEDRNHASFQISSFELPTLESGAFSDIVHYRSSWSANGCVASTQEKLPCEALDQLVQRARYLSE